jgi:hypothetical protein
MNQVYFDMWRRHGNCEVHPYIHRYLKSHVKAIYRRLYTIQYIFWQNKSWLTQNASLTYNWYQTYVGILHKRGVEKDGISQWQSI